MPLLAKAEPTGNTLTFFTFEKIFSLFIKGRFIAFYRN